MFFNHWWKFIFIIHMLLNNLHSLFQKCLERSLKSNDPQERIALQAGLRRLVWNWRHVSGHPGNESVRNKDSCCLFIGRADLNSVKRGFVVFESQMLPQAPALNIWSTVDGAIWGDGGNSRVQGLVGKRKNVTEVCFWRSLPLALLPVHREITQTLLTYFHCQDVLPTPIRAESMDWILWGSE